MKNSLQVFLVFVFSIFMLSSCGNTDEISVTINGEEINIDNEEYIDDIENIVIEENIKEKNCEYEVGDAGLLYNKLENMFTKIDILKMAGTKIYDLEFGSEKSYLPIACNNIGTKYIINGDIKLGGKKKMLNCSFELRKFKNIEDINIYPGPQNIVNDYYNIEKNDIGDEGIKYTNKNMTTNVKVGDIEIDNKISDSTINYNVKLEDGDSFSLEIKMSPYYSFRLNNFFVEGLICTGPEKYSNKLANKLVKSLELKLKELGTIQSGSNKDYNYRDKDDMESKYDYSNILEEKDIILAGYNKPFTFDKREAYIASSNEKELIKYRYDLKKENEKIDSYCKINIESYSDEMRMKDEFKEKIDLLNGERYVFNFIKDIGDEGFTSEYIFESTIAEGDYDVDFVYRKYNDIVTVSCDGNFKDSIFTKESTKKIAKIIEKKLVK